MFYFSATFAPHSNIKELERQQNTIFLSRWEFCWRHFALISMKLAKTNIILCIIRWCFNARYTAEYRMMSPLIHMTFDHEHHYMTLDLPNTIFSQRMTACARAWVCVCRTDERHLLSQKSINNWQMAVEPHFSLCLLLSLIKRLRTC